MRPKKTILLVDGDDLRHSARRFILETRGYAVLSAHNFDEAGELLNSGCDPYVLVLSDTVHAPNQMITLARRLRPELRALEILDRDKLNPCFTLADAVRSWHPGQVAEVLNTICILVARKRGPKKPPNTEARSAA